MLKRPKAIHLLTLHLLSKLPLVQNSSQIYMHKGLDWASFRKKVGIAFLCFLGNIIVSNILSALITSLFDHISVRIIQLRLTGILTYCICVTNAMLIYDVGPSTSLLLSLLLLALAWC